MECKAYFVSDLHMFARRSFAQEYTEEIARCAADAQIFVLGGDIFDFKWTTLESVRQTVDAAIEWLRRLVEPNPACDFHFILGNHDAKSVFVERLDDFADATAHFTWHRYFWRYGNCVFLHGDIADGRIDHETLDVRRGRWDRSKTLRPSSHLLYDLAVRAQLHRLIGSLAHRERAVLKNVLAYVHHIGHGPHSGTEHVYFGHIHRVLDGIQYGGLTFHNGGAAIRGNQFRIIQAQLREPE
jgi:UDP-2,3-diacylglucosamine hydrolase